MNTTQAIMNLMKMRSDYTHIQKDKVQYEAIDLAIEALKEQVEREKGCEFCNEYKQIGISEDGNPLYIQNNIWFDEDENYCKHCGRKIGR
jgi:gamma-glutamylcysteine synthetase